MISDLHKSIIIDLLNKCVAKIDVGDVREEDQPVGDLVCVVKVSRRESSVRVLEALVYDDEGNTVEELDPSDIKDFELGHSGW